MAIDLKVLKARVRTCKMEKRGALAELVRLSSQSQKGTLNKITLESGLKKIRGHCKAIRDHWP